MPILEVEGLAKTFGSRKVVDGVTFSVDFGEIVGLLGPNGAGKTTSFRMTCGMIESDEGQVILDGIDVTRWPMYRRAKEGRMGYLAQESSVFRKLTVEQNLISVMELLNFDRARQRNRANELLEQFAITHIRKSKAGSLSGGERRRLEIARCLISEPEIILLDEPFTGIDPVTIQSIQEIIRDLKKRGYSILITDHQWRETSEITDRIYLIGKGVVKCHGTPQEVINHPEAQAIYFGTGAALGSPAVPPPHTPLVATPGKPGRIAASSIHEEETLRLED